MVAIEAQCKSTGGGMYVLLAGLLTLLLTLCLPTADALRCLSCKGCSKFEDSQAVHCAPVFDRCLKLHMPSGLINRECGDEKMCQEKSNDRERHSAVHCCDANMCNGAPSVLPAASFGGFLVIATSFRFLF